MTTSTLERSCDPATAITRSLLGWGVVAGPFYVAVSLAQALTRDGFDLTRHAWSLLENGDLGWIQSANFVLTGAMVVAFAVGLRRATGDRLGPPAARPATAPARSRPAIFRADPVVGFPAGTPVRPRSVGTACCTWPVGAHRLPRLIAACLILARRFAGRGPARLGRVRPGHRGGVPGRVRRDQPPAPAARRTLPFVVAVVLACGWLSALSVPYRTLPLTTLDREDPRCAT